MLMNWTTSDVAAWLVKIGFEKFVDKFQEEEIDGLTLFHLSSSSIEELLSINTSDGIVKKATIGVKTKFQQVLNNLKDNGLSHSTKIVDLNDKQADVFIEELCNNTSTDVSFLNAFGIENDDHPIGSPKHQRSILSDSNRTNELMGRSSITSHCNVPIDVIAEQSIEEDPLVLLSTNETNFSLTKKFPLLYVLPNFDKSFDEAAQDPSISQFGSRCRKKQQLVKTIRDDVINTYGVDFYPTTSEFDRMVVSVRNRYPSLVKVFGEDMGLLTSSLKQQFSRDRQISGHSSEILVRKRLSHGHPMSGRKLKFVKVELVSRRAFLVEEQNQSEESLLKLSEQAESMRILINTTNFDYAQVKAKMDLTYTHRQRLVQETKPIKEIVQLYPALAITDLFVREVNIHSDPFCGDIVKGLSSNLENLFRIFDHDQKEDVVPDEQYFFVLENMIMKRFKHSKKLLLYHEAIDAYPTIQIQMLHNVKNYTIVIEYDPIITTHSQIEAIALLIGSYEIFNIEYPSKLRATLEVLNGLSFKKRSFSISLAAKRFFNEYKLGTHMSLK